MTRSKRILALTAAALVGVLAAGYAAVQAAGGRTGLIIFYVKHFMREDNAPFREVSWQQGPAAPATTTADAAAAPGARRPPNIVLIVVDDLGYADLTLRGRGIADGLVPTRNIDSIAREGVDFTVAYAGNATCAPSRAAIMTGRYATRFGFEFTPTPKQFMQVVTQSERKGATLHRAVYFGDGGPDQPAYADMGLPVTEITLARLLRDGGYHSVQIGKWHLGDSPRFRPYAHGFHESLSLQHAASMFLPEDDPRVVNARSEADPIDQFLYAAAPWGVRFNDGPLFKPDRYLTDYLTDHAVRVIEANRNRPFFLYLAHSMPHVPLFRSAAFQGTAPGGVYGDVLAEIDASVGSVLAALRRTGHADDTLVIFTSDNGPWLLYGNHGGSAGPLREGKGTVFEGGIREPCVARLPGVIPPGTVSDALLSSIDVLPTVAALTGEPLPVDRDGFCEVAGKRIDGHDRRGAFAATEPPAASDAVTQWYYFKTGELQAVRRGRWKLLLPHSANSMAGQERGRDGRSGRPAPLKVGGELYDLRSDVGEQRDVAAAHPEIVAELEKAAEAARAELGDALTGRTGAGVRPPGGVVTPPQPRPAAGAGKPSSPRPPSVLVILSDDQRADTIHALGNEAIRTPALDSLVARGTVFDRAYCMGSMQPAVCVPSRAMLLSGRSLFHADPHLSGCETWPEQFERAGYRTFVTGKWHNGAESVHRCFAEGDAVFLGGMHDQRSVPTVSFRDHGKPAADARHALHSSELFGNAAERFVQRLGDEPFFAWVSFTAPHDPRQAPDAFRARWNGREPPPPANFLPEHPFDNGELEIRDELTLLRPRTRADISKALADYHACVEAMDDRIGRILAALEAKGRLSDTIVLFTSDHGLALGSHGLLGKQNLYEHSMRSPAIPRRPGGWPI